MKQSLNLSLGAFTLDALVEGDHRDAARTGLVAPRIARTIRYYLSEEESGRPGWRYPRFREHKEESERVDVRLELSAAVASELEREAERQQIPAEDLVEHAVLYFVADRDAGRVTRRILDGLDDEE